jgi:hypothetical protein
MRTLTLIANLGIFCALAFIMAVLSLALRSGSPPLSFAAIVMFLASLGNNFDILSHLFSFDALLYSNALPIVYV